MPFVRWGKGGVGVVTPPPRANYFALFLANAFFAFVATAAGITHVVFFASATRVCSFRRYARSTFGDTPHSFASSVALYVFAAMVFTSLRCVVNVDHNVIVSAFTSHVKGKSYYVLHRHYIADRCKPPLPAREGGIAVDCVTHGAKREGRLTFSGHRASYAVTA